MEMGHSDFILLADANYPAVSGAKRLIRMDAAQIGELLDAILRFMPLDNFVENPVTVMKPREKEPIPEIWSEYEEIIKRRDNDGAFSGFRLMERLEFYEFARGAFATVQTGTATGYANIVLQKGVV
jgi:L-fucose mutarotase